MAAIAPAGAAIGARGAADAAATDAASIPGSNRTLNGDLPKHEDG